MSDLTKLRCFNPSTGKHDGGYCVWEGKGKCMKCEAADEIERLETHKDHCFDRMRTMQAEIERLRAENEKLKECIAEWQKDSALNGRW